MKNFTVKRFGSFWAGDIAQNDNEAVLYHKGAVPRFEDSTLDESVNIPWVWIDGKWFAKATVLTNISWNELNAYGFTTGRPVRMDGQLFHCRSPHLDVNPDCCEFRRALDASGQGDELWNWSGYYFMGDRTIGMENNDDSVAACCWIDGMYPNLSRTEYLDCSERNCFVGFRPILEPLRPMKPIADMVGCDVIVWSNTWKFEGHLKEVGLYDLVLDGYPDPKMGDGWKDLAVVDNGQTVIEREKIIYMRRTFL